MHRCHQSPNYDWGRGRGHTIAYALQIDRTSCLGDLNEDSHHRLLNCCYLLNIHEWILGPRLALCRHPTSWKSYQSHRIEPQEWWILVKRYHPAIWHIDPHCTDSSFDRLGANKLLIWYQEQLLHLQSNTLRPMGYGPDCCHLLYRQSYVISLAKLRLVLANCRAIQSPYLKIQNRCGWPVLVIRNWMRWRGYWLGCSSECFVRRNTKHRLDIRALARTLPKVSLTTFPIGLKYALGLGWIGTRKRLQQPKPWCAHCSLTSDPGDPMP